MVDELPKTSRFVPGVEEERVVIFAAWSVERKLMELMELWAASGGKRLLSGLSSRRSDVWGERVTTRHLDFDLNLKRGTAK